MIDNRTPNLNLPLPNVNNLMKTEDVPRIRDSITSLDQAVSDRATHAEVTAAIAAVLGGAPGALNTLKELADALGNDANYAASIATALAGKLSSIPLATSVTVGGFKVGSGLVIDQGVLSTTGAGSGTGLPSFAEVKFSPTANGQTAFTPAGGYVAGQIELYQNGILLYGGGDDYTASNGTTITLTVGANIVDSFILRKWYYIPIEMAVNKTGDTMTGYLNVPANASGNQAPRVSEVLTKTGGTLTGALVLAADPVLALGAATRQFVLVGDHCVIVHTGNLYGSTNTMIRRYTTAMRNVGTAIVYADSATLGASFTIAEDGIYAIQVQDYVNAGATGVGASLNSSQLTTQIANNAVANRLGYSQNNSASTATCTVTFDVRLSVGDVIRPHGIGAAGTTDSGSIPYFSIRKIAK